MFIKDLTVLSESIENLMRPICTIHGSKRKSGNFICVYILTILVLLFLLLLVKNLTFGTVLVISINCISMNS